MNYNYHFIFLKWLSMYLVSNSYLKDISLTLTFGYITFPQGPGLQPHGYYKNGKEIYLSHHNW